MGHSPTGMLSGGVFDSKRVRNDARATEISWLRFTLSYSLKSVHTS